MALEQSILKSTKKKLNLDENYNAFDLDVIDYINSAFFKLNVLGIGPSEGFRIEGDEEEWDDFEVDLNDSALNAVKTFVNLSVRLVFDPPGTSYHIKAIEDQLQELTHQLLTERNINQVGIEEDVEIITGGGA